MTYFVTNNCMDIAGVVENPDIAAEIMRYSEIRNETLNRCYTMENYKDLSLEEKNKIYDRIKREVELELMA